MKKSILYSIATVLLVASSSYGYLIFSDNFNNDRCMSRQLINWTVNDGTIDVVGSGPRGSAYEWFNGTYGYYIDLDGGTFNAARMTSNMVFEPGLYELTFDLAGSQRGDVNTVDLYFGSANHYTYTMNGSEGWATISLDISLTDFSYLVFDHRGGDKMGLLLDNVSVNQVNAAVPEPSAVSLFILGLASLLGLSIKRRN
jgi:hypothetical protein